MLNGVAPFFLFKFPITASIPILSGIPILSDAISLVGLPIPVYLDEGRSGVLLKNQEKNIDIDTQPEQSADGKTLVLQRGINNTVTINFVANKNSTLLSLFLAFADEIFTRAVNRKYSVSYFNGSTLIFDGLVHSFSAQESDDDELVHISMTIQKTNQQTRTNTSIDSINPTAGSPRGPGVP